MRDNPGLALFPYWPWYKPDLNACQEITEVEGERHWSFRFFHIIAVWGCNITNPRGNFYKKHPCNWNLYDVTCAIQRWDLASSDHEMHHTVFRIKKEQRLTVVTILRMAAEAMSSPLGWPTRVMPRYFTLNTIPSSSVSLVSVQFSGSSGGTKRKGIGIQTTLKTNTIHLWPVQWKQI